MVLRSRNFRMQVGKLIALALKGSLFQFWQIPVLIGLNRVWDFLRVWNRRMLEFLKRSTQFQRLANFFDTIFAIFLDLKFWYQIMKRIIYVVASYLPFPFNHWPKGQVRCLFNTPKRTWLGFFSISQFLPVTGYTWHTLPSTLSRPGPGLPLPERLFPLKAVILITYPFVHLPS